MTTPDNFAAEPEHYLPQEVDEFNTICKHILRNELAAARKILDRRMRDGVAEQSNAADMIAEERDAWEKRAKTEATLRLQCANDSQMHLDRALAAEADNAALRAERDALKMEKKARSMIDPVTRLHNLCDGLAESRGESPYDEASWELADADNKQLRQRAEAAEAENAALRNVLIDVTAHLVAAHSLLERGGKKAAASDKMFYQMLKDYAASIARGRAALLAGKNADALEGKK